MHPAPVISHSNLTRLLLDGDTLSIAAYLPDGQLRNISDSIVSVRSVIEQGNLTAKQLEVAIERTEEIIMPMLSSLPANTELEALGATLADVMHLILETGKTAAPIQSVEQLFNQLADHAGGSAIAWRHPVPAQRIATGLVILREVMFHGGFSVAHLPR
ncbi:MAG: hypothetical protein ABII81_07565 [Pseudomonadota bacterium]